MSNTKIVIDKEDWDKIASEFNSNDLPTATEIQIDQSIEERADKFLDDNCFYNSITRLYNGIEPNDLVNFATSQQIIEQLRVKEKERPFPCMSDEICKEQCGACGYIQDNLTK